jgi:hypothetical protein
VATALDSDLVFSNITIGSSLRKPNTHGHQYCERVCACVRVCVVGVQWRGAPWASVGVMVSRGTRNRRVQGEQSKRGRGPLCTAVART